MSIYVKIPVFTNEILHIFAVLSGNFIGGML